MAVEADNEHGAPVTLADRLVGSEHRRVSAFWCGIADALAEAAMAEFVSAAKEFNGKVGAVGSERGLHGAVVLIAKGQEIRPHAKRV